MGFKRRRLGPLLVEAARSGLRWHDAHVFLGGTGAVGGTALLQMLSLYEELFSIRRPPRGAVPVLVATGAAPDEIHAFTRRLFRFVESRHGRDLLPRRVPGGFLTHSGILVALERFEVAPLPRLHGIGRTPPERRPEAVTAFLEGIGTSPGDQPATVREAVAKTVAAARPFTSFLQRYVHDRLRPMGIERIRSVVLGIPVPSLVAYQEDELQALAEHVPALAGHLGELKDRFVVALRDDLVDVRRDLAEEVMVAHTTGVGGMVDEEPGREPAIRLAFAHAALDLQLAEKYRFATELRDLYASAGLKVLITAAAIGIDEIRVRERIPLHRAIRAKLARAGPDADPDASDGSRSVIRIHRPVAVPLLEPGEGPVEFESGRDLVPSLAIRSGENGFFSVANADALYRVMRVASAEELGLLLATVGMLGDDPLLPWFAGNVCYYPETENARRVLDLLRQPLLLDTQLSGLEPMALQDLGSAKHQGELHTLGLLILLHRLRTLDVDALEPFPDLARFDPRAFFAQRSKALTFEDLVTWDFGSLARDLRTLVAGEVPEDLLGLIPPRDLGPFPDRRAALLMVLNEVLHAAWTPPSLGSPIVYEEEEGRAMLRTGRYVAPLDLLVTGRGAVERWLRDAHAASGNPSSFEDYRDYHLTVGGFIDVRPHAVVCSAKDDRADLTGAVARFTDEAALRRHLHGLEPYGFFATSGLLAVWLRLRALYRLLGEARIELGTLPAFLWEVPRDLNGRLVLVPGVVEAFRMVSEGLEKATGTERLAGIWGYERLPVPDRREDTQGVE